MNETIYEGTNLEEALGKATEALGLAVDEMQYEVTEESDGGFWGVDEAFVRLRAWPRADDNETTADEATPEDDAEALPIMEDSEDETQAAPAEESSTTAAPIDPPAEVPAEPEVSTRELEQAKPAGAASFWDASEDNAAEPGSGVETAASDAVPTPDSAPAATEDAPEITTELMAPETSGDPAPGKDAPAEEAPESGEASDEGESDKGATAVKSETAETEEGDAGDVAADASPEIESLVSKILAGMDFDCTIDVQAEAEVYMAMVGGADKDFFLEGNGRPLSALELILNHAFRHRLTERRKIRVDAGDFRSRREDELRDLAFQVAHSAKESERTEETQPLNPYERRLVHLALAEDSGVTTRSRGSGFLKNVQVIPRRSGRGNR
jgi:spoIIIJ-associated protein